MMEAKELKLKVNHHPSGRYTLVEKSGGSANDVQSEDLFGELNEAKFYRAVAKHLALRASEGWTVQYEDISSDH